MSISFDPSEQEPITGPAGRRGYGSCVRDVSWHSQQPVMLSAAWGAHGDSTVARHEWKGLTKTAGALEDWVEKNRQESSERTARRMPGQFYDSDDD